MASHHTGYRQNKNYYCEWRNADYGVLISSVFDCKLHNCVQFAIKNTASIWARIDPHLSTLARFMDHPLTSVYTSLALGN